MNIVCLSGGVGGAKLALGLSHALPPDDLTVIANTGDDFEHLGFPVCPDIDTLVYTLSGLANQELGWGRKDETGHFMETVRTLGGPDWFFLGDRDLAMHVTRKAMLASGMTLTEVTAALSERMGIRNRILPMCDQPAPTLIETSDGTLEFQDYFVRQRAAPVVTGVVLAGGDYRQTTAHVAKSLRSADAIIIAPSNPLISIDPILAVDGVREAISDSGAPVIAVSPIVGGKAIKGPTAKMMTELGEDASVVGVASRYSKLVSHIVIDNADISSRAAVQDIIPKVSTAHTVMQSLQDRIDLARHVIGVAAGSVTRQ